MLQRPVFLKLMVRVEPDWRRLPAYRDVTDDEWYSAKWQRRHTVKNLDELRGVYGDLLAEDPLCRYDA